MLYNVIRKDALLYGGVLFLMCWPIDSVLERFFITLIWIQACFDAYEQRISTWINAIICIVCLPQNSVHILLETAFIWGALMLLRYGLSLLIKRSLCGDGDLDFVAALSLRWGWSCVWDWAVLTAVYGLILMILLRVDRLPWVSMMTVMIATNYWYALYH